MSAENLRERAFKLYRAPFRYEMGYVWDARNEMVADDHVAGAAELEAVPPVRVRGWGRIGYLPGSESLQDMVGALIAEALTKLWREHFKGAPPGLTGTPPGDGGR